MLGSTVLSKLTLISLTGRLRRLTHSSSQDLNVSKINITMEDRNSAVTLYWHLLLIVLIPNILTFLRCLLLGVLGKTTKSFPWPSTKALMIVSINNKHYYECQSTSYIIKKYYSVFSFQLVRNLASDVLTRCSGRPRGIARTSGQNIGS